ncbi:MAG: hypothetical protein WC712_00845 [Candidatus Brocadiia bacterium]
MKRVLFAFLLLALAGVAYAAFMLVSGGGVVFPVPSASPGASPLTDRSTAAVSLPPLGLDDVAATRANINQAVALGKPAIEALKGLAQRGSSAEKVDALDALVQISPADASDIAVGLLDNPDSSVVIAALKVEARSGDVRLGQKIDDLVKHADPVVRTAALYAAAFALQERSLKYLIDALTDSDAVVRAQASTAIDAVSLQSFGFPHSGYPSQQDEIRKKIAAWFFESGSKTRFDWLKARASRSLDDLVSTDLFVRYDAASFLAAYLGENDYNPWDEPDKSSTQVETLRRRWSEYEPLFKAKVPLVLTLAIE